MSNLIRWDPVREFVPLREAMDRMFAERFSHLFNGWPLLEGELRTLALDVSETDDSLVVEASLPGYDADEVDLAVSGNVLMIKGEHKGEVEKEEKGKYHYRERHSGTFQRSITLPVEVNAEAAEATFEKGVLTLTLPKIEATKPKRIEIKGR